MTVQNLGSVVSDFHTGAIGDMQRAIVGTGEAVSPWVQEVANGDVDVVKGEIDRAELELASGGWIRQNGAPANSLVSLLWHPMLGDKKLQGSDLTALRSDYAAVRGRLFETSAAFAAAPAKMVTELVVGSFVSIIGGSVGVFGNLASSTDIVGALGLGGLAAALLGAMGLYVAVKKEENHNSNRNSLTNLTDAFLATLPEKIASENFKTPFVKDPMKLVTGGYAQRYVREMIGEAEGMIAAYSECIRDLEIIKMRTGSRVQALYYLGGTSDDAKMSIDSQNQDIDMMQKHLNSAVTHLNTVIARFRALPAAPQGESMTESSVNEWCAQVLSVTNDLTLARGNYQGSIAALKDLGLIASQTPG